MFTAVFYYKYEDADLNEIVVGDTLFEDEKEAKRFYFWDGETVNDEHWDWNETKKRYEYEGINYDWDDDDRYGKKFHTNGILIEIKNTEALKD